MQEFQECGHDLGNVAQLAGRLLHVEVCAKAQVAQDVEHEPVDPVTHVDRSTRFPLLQSLLPEQLEPSVNVGVQKRLGIA